jgi:hypothetical protein
MQSPSRGRISASGSRSAMLTIVCHGRNVNENSNGQPKKTFSARRAATRTNLEHYTQQRTKKAVTEAAQRSAAAAAIRAEQQNAAAASNCRTRSHHRQNPVQPVSSRAANSAIRLPLSGHDSTSCRACWAGAHVVRIWALYPGPLPDCLARGLDASKLPGFAGSHQPGSCSLRRSSWRASG